MTLPECIVCEIQINRKKYFFTVSIEVQARITMIWRLHKQISVDAIQNVIWKPLMAILLMAILIVGQLSGGKIMSVNYLSH